jgi:hypothetical protein
MTSGRSHPANQSQQNYMGGKWMLNTSEVGHYDILTGPCFPCLTVGLLNEIPTYLETTISKLTWWLGFSLSMILLSRQKGDQCGFSYIQVPCVVPTHFTHACTSLCICATWRSWNFLQLKKILGFQSGLRKMLLTSKSLKNTMHIVQREFRPYFYCCCSHWWYGYIKFFFADTSAIYLNILNNKFKRLFISYSLKTVFASTVFCNPTSITSEWMVTYF